MECWEKWRGEMGEQKEARDLREKEGGRRREEEKKTRKMLRKG